MQRFASTLRFSNYFAAIQYSILLGSIISVLYLPWWGISKILFMVIIISYGILNFYQQKQWDGISHDEDGWYLKQRDAQTSITISGNSTITPFVTLLCFHQPGKRYKQSYMIFKDAMPEMLYRELTVRLRYFKASTKNER